MTIAFKRSFIAGGVLALVIAVTPLGMAYAQHGDDNNETTTSNETATGGTGSGESGSSSDSSTGVRRTSRDIQKAEGSTAHNETGISDQGDDKGGLRGKGKLAEAKLKVCERHQEAIKTIMLRGHQRAQKQITLFTTIAERTEAFYTSKGKTLSNYDELVASVNSAKAQAETDLAAIPTTFDCNGSDPKGDAQAYKTALEKERTDLQAFRTAVKNLIVGVKSVQGDAQ